MQLLPYEDPYTKGYKIRDRLIDKKYEKNAYVGGGVQPTILLDGKIIGTWNRSMKEGKGPIKLYFFQHPESEIEREGVKKAHAVAGQFDAVVYVEFPKTEDLGKIIEKIQHLKGVRETQTLIAIPPTIRK